MADRGALRDGPPEGGGPSRRCPTCGRRTASVDPGCPEHGPIGPGEASREAASSRPEELPSFGELRAARVLGRGGFGVVYEAVREADGARLAVKLARAEVAGAAHRLEREIEALRAIGPPTVPAVRGAGALDDGAMYVVMDLIAAPTLAARLAARPGPLPAPYFGAIAAAVTSAVAVVHARGRVHLDLKPENVLIDDLFRVTLIDFGLGSPAEDDGPGVAVGTTEYMSPEQCDGRPALDARADVYALGVLFYEMLAGRPPVWGAPPAVRESHRTRRPVPPSTLARVAPPVEDVVLRCLAKRPEDRFESARALHDALTAALAAARDVPPPSSATWAARLEAA
ncbi:MAG: serine/threonine protein kinase, partial [Polyangiaceae bacterium]|nr:serine/threonine protein kinase [Polyangiaceae bacterium]